jgi:hypothetical protein
MDLSRLRAKARTVYIIHVRWLKPTAKDTGAMNMRIC